MDIPLTDTQSAHASAETFVKVITNYSQLSAMPRSSPPATPPAKQGLGLEDGAVQLDPQRQHHSTATTELPQRQSAR
jgi:hypothetical protein